MEIENRIKIAMALAIDEGAKPLYTTGFAYWQVSFYPSDINDI